MSTTDVAPLVTPAYTATLPVTNSGSILTQADLTTLVVSLANRIEFVRQLSSVVSSSFSAVKDDFCFVDEGAIVFGTPRIWHGDTPWRATQLAAGTLALNYSDTGGFTDNHGILQIKSTSGTTGVCLDKGAVGAGAGKGVRFGKFLGGACNVRFGNVASPVKFEFGLQADSTAIRASNEASISFLYDPTVNPNWLARTSLTAGSSEHLTDTGVPPVAGLPQTLRITQTDETDRTYEWRINNTLVATKRTSAGTFFIPGSGAGFMRIAGQVPVFTSNETIDVDLVQFENNSLGR